MKKSNINVFFCYYRSFQFYIFEIFFRRFFYEYCLRNPDMKFISFIFGLLSLIFGVIFSINVWKTGIEDMPSTSGTVAVALISLLVGINFISYFFFSDMTNYPKKVLQLSNNI